ncbi:hypothetical protein TRIATDRAFT_268235 [Trichoderma atroviride IMI 206040]|uniref:NADP-dependent oxidoreductase domain-containing protein n=1 Tax=Hypocrea atroviridis (strain ATCC 20476 / IMI 206040) TaxID=452589 RepID=G9P4L2_HYPAI|nr:uncharacterized protein TRIATDRAFT_268235 [Trichoderma atroviride IMI 206040]EHK41998.1 hypothetical protein TRIATDRAFT_268235 [Trichoderma atroviride IMI 206040]
MDLPIIFPLSSGRNVPVLGYRHIDGARAYGNEKEIGQAIKESGIPRHEIFLTTKLAQTWHEPADVQKALEQSLKDLQMEYVPHAYKAGENNGTIRHPSGNGKIIDIAARYQISPAQVCLSWAVQKGIPVIPKSVQESHLQQNIQLTRLSDEDFYTVDQLSSERGPVRFLDPSRHLGFDIFDEENDQPVANGAPWD